MLFRSARVALSLVLNYEEGAERTVEHGDPESETYLTEIAGGILMLTPGLQPWGGLLISFIFLVICTHIRLGFLTEKVMLWALLFAPAGGSIDRFLQRLPAPAGDAAALGDLPAWAVQCIGAALWGYLALLVPAFIGMWINFLGRKRFPAPLQFLLDRYTNLFGMIIWRVFTADVINFFARIHFVDASGRRDEYTDLDRKSVV